MTAADARVPRHLQILPHERRGGSGTRRRKHVRRRGEFVTLTGKSGAGKSTLLAILAGIEEPQSGAVSFDGKPLAALSKTELSGLRRRGIGIVFQAFNLLPAWTALENVEAPLLFTGVPKNERRNRVMEWLGRVGLAGRADHLPAELSVGEQQRVAVARAPRFRSPDSACR